jgi:hypothetical protein
MKKFIYVLTYRHWSNSKQKENSYVCRFNYESSVLFERSIHSLIFKLIVLMSINVFKVVHVLLLIMKSIELLTSCIHFFFVIFRRLYDCRRLMTFIMKRFFCVVSNLIKQSYNDFESMQSTKRTKWSRMLNKIALKVASRSKSWTSAY